MKKWQISCNGWYIYCPVCYGETDFRTPICMNCGELLQPVNSDVERMKKEFPNGYMQMMNKYYKKIGEE